MSKKKVLLIRLDKIGDLICTLPVDQFLHETDFDVTWIIQKGLGAVVELGQKKRKYLELDKADRHASAEKLRNLIDELKPDAAISFQGPWWVNFELFKAQIQLRSGVYSQWHSFLFLNSGLRQKRSQAVQHEFDYNKDLTLQTLQLKEDKRFQYFAIAKPDSTAILKKYNLLENNYIVVHPGMMGSALNWQQSQYIEFIHEKIRQQKVLCITGTVADEPYLNEIKKEFVNHSSVLWLQNQLSLKELIQLLSASAYVVAPSTGVAHLAASVGATIHGIYSPVRVHHPRRWAPRGPHVIVHCPENTEPGNEIQAMKNLQLRVE